MGDFDEGEWERYEGWEAQMPSDPYRIPTIEDLEEERYYGN